MKEVSRSTFLKMPSGTVFFKKYKDGIAGCTSRVCVLDWVCEVDFGCTPIGGFTPCGDMDSVDVWFQMHDEINSGKEFPHELTGYRDGLYETEDEVSFVVLSKDEVQQVIDLLQDALQSQENKL